MKKIQEEYLKRKEERARNILLEAICIPLYPNEAAKPFDDEQQINQVTSEENHVPTVCSLQDYFKRFVPFMDNIVAIVDSYTYDLQFKKV